MGWGGGVEAGYTARKFLTKQGVTSILPTTAMLGRLNEASQWNLQSKCLRDEIRPVLNVSLEANDSVA